MMYFVYIHLLLILYFHANKLLLIVGGDRGVFWCPGSAQHLTKGYSVTVGLSRFNQITSNYSHTTFANSEFQL